MSASKSPHGFAVVRGRGYRPEQVDRFTTGLYGELEEARERLTRLGVLAGELEQEAERLWAAVETLAPQTYEALGERSQRILAESEAEAEDVYSRAKAEGRALLEKVEAEGRAARERAREEAARARAESERAAEALLDSARERAEGLRGEARAEADWVRREAAGVLRETGDRCEALLAAQEKKHAEASEALDRELAEREARVEARINELTERGDSVLAEARRVHAEAEEAARHRLEDGQARAAELVAQARVRAGRVERETERVLHDHEEQREEIRQHMAHVRSSLAALTGRVVEEDELPGGGAGGAVPGQGAPTE